MVQNRILIVAAAAVFLSLFSCQPHLLKRPGAKSEPDSVLFYQKKDLHDPFLDAVLAYPHDEVELSQTVVPPPAPRPKFQQMQGFRVQVFASGDSLNAVRQKAKISSLISDTCLIVKEKNLFKVQVGNFPKRIAADSLKDYLKTHGFNGAWVVQTTIFVPVATVTPAPQPADSAAIRTTNNLPSANTPFRIQVFATGDQSKAVKITKELKQTFNLPCTFEQKGALFKIYINGFNTRAQAETVLRKVKNAGYKDAWIVHQ